MASVLVQFEGASGVGKTTLCASLFSHLKALGISCEFVGELTKVWAYEGKTVNKYDQFYLFGLEVHKQSRLFNKVDVIIADAPVSLVTFYNSYYNNGDDSLSPACKEFYTKAQEDDITVLNFLLPRKKEYVQEGRFQSREEADEVAIKLREWLDNECYSYTELDCDDKERLDKVLEKLEEVLGRKLNGFSLV